MTKRREPISVGNVVAEIMARRGIGRERASGEKEQRWREVIGAELAPMTRCGEIRRGRLEIIVVNSTLMHELTFRKQEIIDQFNKQSPETVVKDIRFRIGTISSQ